MHIQLNRLARRLVLDATGDVLGRIKAPIVDTETWLVDILQIKPSRRVAGELGLAWSWWRRPTVEISTGLINASGDAVILRVSLAELRDATPSLATEAAAVSIH